MKKKLSLFDKKTRSLPEVGEFVLGTVTQIFPYGVFVKLDEYDIVGMVHIKEVSTGWVKNIRNYVKERQKVVTKVLKMDPSRRYIDLSLKRVTQKQAKLRKQQYRTERRVEKLLQYYSEDNGIPWNDVLERIVKPIEDKFEDMFYGFEEIVKNKSLLENLVPKEYQESFYNLLKKNIEIPHVELSGFLEISCFEKNGVEVIKNALIKAQEDGVEIRLVGTPRYSVRIIAEDYKIAEEKLRKAEEKVLNFMSEHKGEAKFFRN